MRVLQITTEAPGAFSGGQIGVRQTFYSLIENGYEVDYTGPEIKDEGLRKQYKNVYELQPIENLAVRIVDSVRGYTNSRYRAWKSLVNNDSFNIGKYDAVIMDFTKLDYVAEDIPKGKLIVRVHNIEADYFAREYAHHKSFKGLILKLTAKKREKKVIECASKLLVLTEKDKDRLMELYGVKAEKICILPVCIKKSAFFNGDNISTADSNEELNEKNKAIKLLITGSLWFGPNFEGIKWFLENVYGKIYSPKQLTIAGAKPNPDLKALIDRLNNTISINNCAEKSVGQKIYEVDRIILADTPADMGEYFKQAELVIAPIFDGAGMKVKVAEALSYGIPVVGTSHAFIGYDIKNGVNSWEADTADGFIKAINDYAKKNDVNKASVRIEAYKLFEEKYCQKVSNELIKSSIKEIRDR